MRWLDVAETYIGLTEVEGRQSNPVILGWLQNEGGGKSWVKDDATPWCGAAMAGIFTEAGMKPILPPEPLRARSWALVGVGLDEPRVGCIMVKPRGSDPRAGHVGIVKAFGDKWVDVLGGNQEDNGSDKVCVQRFVRTPQMIWRWPMALKSPKDMDAQGSRITRAAKRQQADTLKSGGSASSAQLPLMPRTPKEGVTDALGDFGWVKAMGHQVQDFAAFVGLHWWWVALLVAGYYGARVMWDGYQIRGWRTSDENEGWTQ